MTGSLINAYAAGALQLEQDGRVALLTLNRPAARNAVNCAMWQDLPQVAADVAANPTARVLVIRGAAGDFASGADITEFPTVFADRTSALDYARLMEAATSALAALQKPVIAWIEGYCIGAGLAIALACDMRIAATNARFGAPPAKLGLIYSLGDTRRLVNAVGVSTAKSMLFTGALYPAAQAFALGLVNEVHPVDILEAEVRARAGGVARLSAASIRIAKTIVGLVESGVVAETEATRAMFADAALSDDFAEGLAAFQAKRSPVFG
jgi:enoyl-CoA hydratase/carnithine racemase